MAKLTPITADRIKVVARRIDAQANEDDLKSQLADAYGHYRKTSEDLEILSRAIFYEGYTGPELDNFFVYKDRAEAAQAEYSRICALVREAREDSLAAAA